MSTIFKTTSNAPAKQFFKIAVSSPSITISQRSVDRIKKLELIWLYIIVYWGGYTPWLRLTPFLKCLFPSDFLLHTLLRYFRKLSLTLMETTYFLP